MSSSSTVSEDLGPLCGCILKLPKAAVQSHGDNHPVWRYEACRLAAVIYATAIHRGVPLSVAATQATTPLIPQLKAALESSGIGDCWGGMVGMLFWTALVGGAAATAGVTEEYKQARQFCAAAAVQCSIKLGFKHGPAVMESLRRLLRVVEKLEELQPRQGGQNAVMVGT